MTFGLSSFLDKTDLDAFLQMKDHHFSGLWPRDHKQSYS